jgi:hypothetical protein
MLPSAARLTAETTARIGATWRNRRDVLAAAGTAVRGHRKALAVAGAAAALAGAGAGTAASIDAGAPSPAALSPVASHQSVSHDLASRATGASRQATAAARPGTPPRHAGVAVTLAGDRHAAPAPAKPYMMYDSTTPQSIPAHHPVATYANGNFAVPASQVSGKSVTWIDTNGSDPHAAALDVEPGDATPSLAAAWTKAKLTAQPDALAHIYTMRSEWPAVQAAVAGLPHSMQTHVRWWIADPTGVPHQVPGASATQWYWGSDYDISTVAPSFS